MSAFGSIVTNQSALAALNAIAGSTLSTNSAERQISTGLAISSPDDNPAGYITAQGFTSQINGVSQAISNSNVGISLAQSAQGAIQQQIGVAQQLYSIAVQAANGTQTSDERQSLQNVSNQLVSEINNIATQTQFNGINLLDGSFLGVQFQTGGQAGQSQKLSINATTANTLGLQGDGLYHSVVDPNGGFSNGNFPGDEFYQPGSDIQAGLNINNNSTYEHEFSSGSMTILGASGSAPVAVTKGESAYSLAQSINAVSSTTGVSAGAQNKFLVQLGSAGNGSYTFYVQISDGLASGSSKFIGIKGSTGSQLVSQINAQAASTGLSVSMSTNGLLTFSQASGKNVDFFGEPSTGYAMSNNLYTASGKNFKDIGWQSGSDYSYLVDFTSTVQLTSQNPFKLQNGSAVGLENISRNGGSYISSMDLSTQGGAEKAMNVIQGAINQLEQYGANIGAFQDGLQDLSNNLSTTLSNASTALGIVQDANIPAETNTLSSAQIKAQSGVAALKNSTALQQSFLSLLP